MMIFDLNTNVQESGMDKNQNSTTSSEFKKSCIDCQTTRTPCWRSGPAGPKTLCNACGIRYRKKSRRILGVEKGGAEKRKGKLVKAAEVRYKDIFQEQWKRKLGEEEQAAFLLMALSYGCVSA
ncbi:GATA transcription factor 16 isoform X2 [Ricinus communis]|uniref:GATA transcription factor, putative n=1 Tax=Ricinus communis TaxID=3988 RepID=B9RNI7_RICCO|nr:GATA transcription factor 16 isoform X2 [Ricinus communis]EEF47310.1 GATA transcription factor, putative [Ricinus communis]|eukprot:XP_002515326.1 GATA transcription factor 16 isoform X2 [Ricinus communis]